MIDLRTRQFATLKYGDPLGYLVELRNVELQVVASSTPERVRSLRTQGLKPEREMRDAAIFCVGMSERIGFDVLFAPFEDQDFDFVATWTDGQGTTKFCPVQLKEVVPPHLNSGATIQAVVDGLAHYSDSADVTFAIKFNQQGQFDPAALIIPGNLQIGGLWIFGALSPDQSELVLLGDFLGKEGAPFGTKFSYPVSID
jgi:hypothetical protein